MSFDNKKAEILLALCKRCCCICHSFSGIHIELHHIIPKSEGGSDDIENAIPLCYKCHAEVHLNGKNPKGRKYAYNELLKHKSLWIENSKNLNIHEIEKIKNEILAFLDSLGIREIYNTVMGMSAQLEDLIKLIENESKRLEIQDKSSVNIINDSNYYFKLGNVELEYGNYTEAKKHLEAAYKLGMSKSSLYYNLFKVETSLGNYDEALEQYKKAIAKNSESVLIPSRYEILKILGEGGTSIAYKGYDTINHRPVLIKIFKGNITKDYENLSQIEKQVELLKTLDNEFIIKCYDDGFFSGRKYVVYEFIEGQTLNDAITHKSLTKKEKGKIIIRLCEALLFLHNKSILHLDIKPSNIIIRKSDNFPVLSDFGSLLKIGMETHSTFSFTWAYAAPELISPSHENVPITARSKVKIYGKMNLNTSLDIYSLGITIAELLTGTHPKLRYSFQKIGKEYSLDLEKLLIKMTSPEAYKRPNMASVLRQFNKIFSKYNY